MGTAMVICFAIGALLIAAGTPMRHLGADRRRLAALALAGRAARALPARAPDRLPRPVLGRRRHRLPGRAGADRDRLGRPLRRRARRVGAEDLLPARGPHRHDPGDHRRGARAWSGSSAWSALYGMIGYAGLRTAKLARDRYSKLLAAGHHVADPVPGDAQLLRGARPGAADRRAAAVHLLREHQPDRAAGRRWGCC